MQRFAVLFILFTICHVAILSGCAGFIELKGKDYPESARLNYEEGLKYLREENYEIAQKYFGLVKTKFTFSLYATRAELLGADTLRKEDLFVEAIDAYKVFQRNHPTHPCAAYAQYRIGEAYHEQIADDWWFMPPAHERDQDLTIKSVKEYRRLIRMEHADGYYFTDDFEPSEVEVCEGFDYHQRRSLVFLAREHMRFSISRLVAREVSVAKYYLKMGKPSGAVLRLEGAVKKYVDLAEDLEFIKLLARAYREADMYKRAVATWQWIAVNHPASDDAADAEEVIADIREDEAEWKKERKENLAENKAKLEQEKAEREKFGLIEVDPDPDPNEGVDIPLPENRPDKPSI